MVVRWELCRCRRRRRLRPVVTSTVVSLETIDEEKTHDHGRRRNEEDNNGPNNITVCSARFLAPCFGRCWLHAYSVGFCSTCPLLPPPPAKNSLPSTAAAGWRDTCVVAVGGAHHYGTITQQGETCTPWRLLPCRRCSLVLLVLRSFATGNQPPEVSNVRSVVLAVQHLVWKTALHHRTEKG